MENVIYFIFEYPWVIKTLLVFIGIIVLIFTILFIRTRNQKNLLLFNLQILNNILTIKSYSKYYSTHDIRVIIDQNVLTFREINTRFNNCSLIFSKDSPEYEVLRIRTAKLLASLLLEKIEDRHLTSAQLAKKLHSLELVGLFEAEYFVGSNLKDLVLKYIFEFILDFRFIETITGIHDNNSSSRSIIIEIYHQMETLRSVKCLHDSHKNALIYYSEIYRVLEGNESKAKEILFEWIKRGGPPTSLF